MKIFIPTAFARAGGWLAGARGVRAAMTLLLLLVTTTTARAAVSGFVDIVWEHNGSIEVSGWTYDTEYVDTPIGVHVQIWDYYGQNVIKTVGFPADIQRDDVGKKGFHGFVPIENAGTYMVKVAAVGLSGSGYLNGSTPTASGEFINTFYATPGAPWTISYDANGGTGAPAPQTSHWGIPSTLSTVQPTRSGYHFVGWNTAPDGSGLPYPSGYTDIFYVWQNNATLYAQWELNNLAGSGTSDNPYLISSVSDWDAFTVHVNRGNSFSGQYVKLTTDIGTVTTMAGTYGSLFSGYFDGNGHTLTVNYYLTRTNIHCAAPFAYIGNATIVNLHTAGDIWQGDYLTDPDVTLGGLVGYVAPNKTVKIASCRSSVALGYSFYYINNDFCSGNIGGFVGYDDGNVHIYNCLFDGELSGRPDYVGGFVGKENSYGKPVINNCLMSANIDLLCFAPGTGLKPPVSCLHIATFCPDDATVLSNCYYNCYYNSEKNHPRWTATTKASFKWQGTLTNAKGETLRALLGSGWTMNGSGKVVPGVVAGFSARNITLANGITHGTVTFQGSSAIPMENVTLNVTPNEQYVIASVTYNDGSDHVITPQNGVYSFVMPFVDVTVNATFEPIYTIGYDLVGGSVATDNPTTFTVLSDAITLVNPTRDGYIFAGWTGTGLTEPTMTVTIPQGSRGNRVYTATWKAFTGSIDYVYSHNGSISFGGWAYEETNPSTPIPVQVQIWSVNGETHIKTVEFMANNPREDLGYNCGFTGVIPLDEGIYKVKIKAIGVNQVYLVWPGVGSDLYPTVGTPWTISYDANGGTGAPAPQTNHWAVPSTLSTVQPTRPGYVFTGWNTEPDGSGIPYPSGYTDIFYVWMSDRTLYAQWVICDYSITYDLAGGTVAADNPTSYTIKSDAITLVNPTKEEYAFTGWMGTGLAGPTMTVTIPKGSTGNRTYTATWVYSPNVYYNAYNTTTGAFEAYMATTPIPVTGGTTTMGAANKETWYVVNSNVTVNSRMEAKGTVHLILCDGATLTALKGITVYSGNSLNIYGQASGTGTLNATGVKLIGDGTESAAIGSTSNTVMGNLTIHGGRITANGAGWSAGIGGGIRGGGGSVKIYGGTVNATGHDGTSEAIGCGSDGGAVSKFLAKGLRVTTNNNSAPVAYSNRVPALKQKVVKVEPCTAHNFSNNICIYCGFAIHSVTYDGNNATGGTVPASFTEYLTGQTVTVLGNTGNLVRTGYTFSGWNTAANGSGTDYAPGTTFTINNSLTLYAKWTPTPPIGSIDYVYSHNGSISFGGWAYEETNPSTPIPVQVQIWSGENFIKTVEFMANNPREDLGYNCGFTGVIPLDEGTYKVKIMAVGTTSVYLGSDLYRQVGTPWYISYDANGGTGAPEPQTNHWAVPSTLSTVQPTRPGYTFTGWNTEPDGSGVPYPSGYTDNFFYWMSDRTLYAQWSASLLTLANNADNSEAIGLASGDGMYYDVTLAGRTLYKDGDWNTLCLPFDVTIAGSVLDGADVRALDNADLTGGVLTLNFTNQGDVTTIKAGKPYIIRWTKTEGYVDDDEHNLVNPVFRNVTVKSDMNNFVSTDGKVSFCGTYDYTNWTEEKPNILFLGAESQLHWPDAGASLGACRAYFQLTEGAGVREFKLSFGDGTQTIIGHTEITEITERADAWYTVNGVKLSGVPAKKGMYIHGGRKVIVK